MNFHAASKSCDSERLAAIPLNFLDKILDTLAGAGSGPGRRPWGRCQPPARPPESPLWLHPKVTVMPHVARRPTVAQLVTEIAANIRSVEAGGRLLQEVDITLGY